jgi:ribonuclease P protein component
MILRRKRERDIIKTAEEIAYIMENGRRVQTRWYRLIYCPAAQREARFAVIVGKRLGKAVLRNRIKRRFREIVRRNMMQRIASCDRIIIPKKMAAREEFQVIQNALRTTVAEIV